MIRHENMRPGFDKYHLNEYGEEPFLSRPVIHVITQPDEEFHDHPGGFMVWLMRGEYTDEVLLDFFDGYPSVNHIRRVPGHSWFVRADCIHRITDIKGPVETMTLWQPSFRQPRFYRVEDGYLWSRQWDETQYTKAKP